MAGALPHILSPRRVGVIRPYLDRSRHRRSYLGAEDVKEVSLRRTAAASGDYEDEYDNAQHDQYGHIREVR